MKPRFKAGDFVKICLIDSMDSTFETYVVVLNNGPMYQYRYLNNSEDTDIYRSLMQDNACETYRLINGN